jgi:hypothetical protein
MPSVLNGVMIYRPGRQPLAYGILENKNRMIRLQPEVGQCVSSGSFILISVRPCGVKVC